jgi:hypothetical protein
MTLPSRDDTKKMQTPVYRLEVFVIDFNRSNPDEVVIEIERNKYLTVHVNKVEVRDAGEWSDEHPLNLRESDRRAYFEALPNEEKRRG